MRELRINAVVQVPDELFASAAVLAKVQPAIQTFRDALAEIEPSSVVAADVVTPRAKAEDGQPKPRRKRGEAA